MPAIEVITALLQLAAQVAPTVQADFQKGTVTLEQQAALAAAIKAIRESDFTGPEWQVQPDPTGTGSPALPKPSLP